MTKAQRIKACQEDMGCSRAEAAAMVAEGLDGYEDDEDKGEWKTLWSYEWKKQERPNDAR